MSLDSVSKIEIICYHRLRRPVLDFMEESAMVQLVDLSDREGQLSRSAELDTSELEESLSVLDRVISFLSDFEKTPSSLTERMADEPPRFSTAELVGLLESREVIEETKETWRTAREMAELDGDCQELGQEAQLLREWQELPVPVEELGRAGKSYRTLAGTVLGDGIEELHRLIDEEPLAHLEVLSQTPGMQRVFLVLHESVYAEVSEKLGGTGFARQDFGEWKGMAADLLQLTERKLKELTRKEDVEKEKARRQAAEDLDDLRALRDAVGLVLTRVGASSTGRASEKLCMFQGWIRDRDLPLLKNHLEAMGEVSVEAIEPEEDERIPSPLTESPALDPYIMLTDMFGRPTRKDPDPTPLLAPFFALFLGICIGDGGYGLSLAAGAALGWWLVRRRGGNPRLFGVLFQGGLMSVLVGLFLGSWFGISFDSLPGFLRAPANVLNSIVPGYVPGQKGQEGFALSKQFLYVTMALGIVQLAFGVFVNLSKRLRAGEGFIAVVEQSGWILAIAGLFPWLFNHYLLNGGLYDVTGPTDSVLLYMLAAGAVLIAVTGGADAKGLGGRIGLGAYAMYGIVNILGDVLSYSRLFALSLSTAIIGQVVNQIGGMLAGMGIPVVGLVLALLVLLGGHAFNLFMAILSGYIHTARLQFVEFFSKFYDGTGAPFVPLEYQPRFVMIDKQERSSQRSERSDH
jgi:V/A-type H+-transporting ATPase subunit I